MIYDQTIAMFFRQHFRKSLFNDLLKYTSCYQNVDIYMDPSHKSIFFISMEFRYLRPVYECKGHRYLFTFSRSDCFDCLNHQIPFVEFTLLVSDYLMDVDFSLSSENRVFPDKYF